MAQSSPLKFIEENKANDIQYTTERKEYKACIVYLLLKEGTTYWRDYVNELYYNLKDLWDYYNYMHDYPVIIFYDESVTKADIHMLQNARKDQMLVFKNITHVKEEIYEQYIPDPSAYVRCKLNDTNYSIHNMNYVFMNFWRIKALWEQPVLKEFDYYLSIDTDMYPLGKVEPDPFDIMHEKKYIYGYQDEPWDPEECVPTDATNHYVKCMGIIPAQSDPHPNNVFHGNFQLGRIQFFRSPQYKAYTDYLLTLGGLVSHRWSDQTIFRKALMMYLPKESIGLFTQYKFIHSWNYHIWYIPDFLKGLFY
jgi:hypothetical protein